MTHPVKGLRFYHARVLDAQKFDGKTPQLYQVTRVTQSWTYYAPVYDRGFSSERLGKTDKSSPALFCKLIHPTVEYRPLLGNWAATEQVTTESGRS